MATLDTTKTLTDILQAKGCKATQPRLAILRVLRQAKRPLSIQSIRKRLRNVSCDQATVYRVLTTFQGAGLVRQIDLQHGHAHFEITDLPHHHHIVCTSCDRLEDIPGCHADEYANTALRTSKFATIQEHSLEFFGTCNQCAQKLSVK